jgi:hypothetical protein
MSPLPSMHAPGGEYSLLALDRLHVALPRTELRALEAVADVHSGATGGAVGSIEFAGRRLHVFCLDDALRPTMRIPAGRRVCALLDAGEARAPRRFGLLCSGVQHLLPDRAEVHALPAAMRLPATPIGGLLFAQGRMACISSAAALAALLADWDPRAESAGQELAA